MRLMILMAACLLSGPATAQYLTGNKMHEACVKSARIPLITYVSAILDKALLDHGMVETVGDDWVTRSDTAEEKKRTKWLIDMSMMAVRPYCPPEKVTNVQAADVFCKYLAKNPEGRHQNAAALADAAFTEAWPCKIRGGAHD